MKKKKLITLQCIAIQNGLSNSHITKIIYRPITLRLPRGTLQHKHTLFSLVNARKILFTSFFLYKLIYKIKRVQFSRDPTDKRPSVEQQITRIKTYEKYRIVTRRYKVYKLQFKVCVKNTFILYQVQYERNSVAKGRDRIKYLLNTIDHS